jgi:hypothetical protein
MRKKKLYIDRIAGCSRSCSGSSYLATDERGDNGFHAEFWRLGCPVDGLHQRSVPDREWQSRHSVASTAAFLCSESALTLALALSPIPVNDIAATYGENVTRFVTGMEICHCCCLVGRLYRTREVFFRMGFKWVGHSYLENHIFIPADGRRLTLSRYTAPCLMSSQMSAKRCCPKGPKRPPTRRTRHPPRLQLSS